MAWINSTRIPQLGDRHDSADESGTCATYSSRFLILWWQMDSIHKKAPSDMSLRFSVSMVALGR